MKNNNMKRLVSLFLAIIISLLTLVGCYNYNDNCNNSSSSNSNSNDRYSVGDNKEDEFYRYLCKAKLEADVDVFEAGNVELDFYYGLYRLSDGKSLEEIAEGYKNNKGMFDDRRGDEFFTIHISKESQTTLLQGEIVNGYSDIDGAELYKVISHEEAFSGGYGFSLSDCPPYISYEHSEKLRPSKELIGDEDFGLFYIYISTLIDYYDSDEYYVVESVVYLVQYASVGDGRVKILFD